MRKIRFTYFFLIMPLFMSCESNAQEKRFEKESYEILDIISKKDYTRLLEYYDTTGVYPAKLDVNTRQAIINYLKPSIDSGSAFIKRYGIPPSSSLIRQKNGNLYIFRFDFPPNDKIKGIPKRDIVLAYYLNKPQQHNLRSIAVQNYEQELHADDSDDAAFLRRPLDKKINLGLDTFDFCSFNYYKGKTSEHILNCKEAKYHGELSKKDTTNDTLIMHRFFALFNYIANNKIIKTERVTKVEAISYLPEDKYDQEGITLTLYFNPKKLIPVSATIHCIIMDNKEYEEENSKYIIIQKDNGVYYIEKKPEVVNILIDILKRTYSTDQQR